MGMAYNTQLEVMKAEFFAKEKRLVADMEKTMNARMAAYTQELQASQKDRWQRI